MANAKAKNQKRNNGATVGYEAELWQMADALRGSMDAAEYKHVVLGLIFLKYISDAFEELHGKLVAEKAQGADPEDPDEYRGAAHPVFWVPPEARWPHLKAQARQSTIGQLVVKEPKRPPQTSYRDVGERRAFRPGALGAKASLQ